MTSVVEKAFSFAREDCAGKDPSHDFYHVQRVTRLALVLAKEEGVDDLELVELGKESNEFFSAFAGALCCIT